MITEIISFTSLIFSSYLFVRLFQSTRLYEKLMLFFIFATAQTIVIAHILSGLNYLSSTVHWAIGNSLLLIISVAFILLNKNRSQFKKNWSQLAFARPRIPHLIKIKDWYCTLTKTQKIIILPTFCITLTIGFVNLFVVLFTMTNHWDSLSYHLPRVAYYLQHGNLGYYPANYWAQVVHVKNSAILMLYIFLVSGRYENLMQSVQFLSYIVSIFAAYGISRRIGLEKIYSLSAALIYSIFIEVLLEAVTPQNDLLITAYTGIAVYFLLAFKEQRNFKNVFIAILCIGIAIGVKVSFLTLLPSLALIAFYTFLDKKIFNRKFILSISFSLIFVFIVLVLPSGYLQNYLLYNNAIGSRHAVSHSYAGNPFMHKLRHGSLNMIRYSMDSLSLDGLPGKTSYNKLRSALLEHNLILPEKNPFIQLQFLLKFVPIKIIQFTNIPVESTVKFKFDIAKTPRADEDTANLGVLGFGLLFIAIILLLLNVIKNPAGRVLALAAVLFFTVQCFAGRYDPWRGRYFIYSAVFAAPAIGCLIKRFENKKVFKIYLVSILIVGWISAIGATGVRQGPRIWTALHTSERLVQMSLNYSVFNTYEKLVPANATVAVYFPQDSLEYQLFGDKLTRTIIPVRPFRHETAPDYSNADYLIYRKDETIDQEKNDIYLGKEGLTNGEYYLRRINK